MIIEKIDPARECYSDYSLDGGILTIGGIEVDLAAEEGDQEVVISFGACNGMVHQGLKPCCTYVADVVIPPRKWETTTRVPEESGGEMEEEPGEATETVAAPLDLDAVTLRLWPVVDEAENETGNTATVEGEENGAQ
jgi:hypothetical protein